ncbi:hypothetical protein EVAR_100062_1 [Eumeta japonica]|uniref:Peptidase A2 domain-containing protein n=1 Tax=Eumeta variegata TaxID=151549 RepID=A0A4C2A0H5_EUMVA|nr:hypothetical protein EVAR_100062_1 [Eumeta japonica]
MELREIRAAKALAKTDRALGQLYDDEECLDTCHETVEIPTDRSRTTFESQTADETAGIRERGQTNTTVYRDTQCHFTESQNVARLRKALKGDARENVKSLLYSGASADDILDSLQRYFGRPEILILNELENIKKMPKLAEDGRNMNVFASRQMRPQYDDSDVDNDNENRHREPRVETTAIITNDERRRTFDKIVKIMSNMQKRTLFERLCNFHSVTHRRKMGTREKAHIIPVEISGPLGRLETYALLDEGSTTTLIERDVALKIAPPGKHETLRIEGVGGKRLDYDESFRLKVKIKGKFERNIESMNALVIDKLQLAPQTIDLDTVRQYSHLHELEDELSYEKARPTILIGQDNWHLIVSREVVQRTEINRPLRTLNWDGYCTAGRTASPARYVINYIAREPSAEDEIGKLIKENFSIECLGIEAKKPSNDLEQRALKVLDDTSRRLPDGRFEIGLIWKTDNEIMPDNKRYAENDYVI